jgi:hypothetical protein
MTNQRLPLYLKSQTFQFINQSKSILLSGLLNTAESESDLLVQYLDCFYVCGFLYLISYRFSITTISQSTSSSHITHASNTLTDLQDYLTDLNKKLNLKKRIKEQMKSSNKSFKILFYLNKLQLINVYAMYLLNDESSYDESCIDFLIHDQFDLGEFKSKKLKKSQYELIEAFNFEVIF